MILESPGSFGGIKRGYDALTIWLPAGLAMLALPVFLVSVSRQALSRRAPRAVLPVSCASRSGGRQFNVPKTAVALLVSALGLAGLRAYATHVEPYWLQVRDVVIATEKVDRPVRVLHISDIQSFRVGDYERQAFARMRELRPDLVLFTGDLLQSGSDSATRGELPKLAALFAGLEPPLGKLGVLGNCDAVLRRSGDLSVSVDGLDMLDGRSVAIRSGTTRIDVLGLTRLAAQRMDASGRVVTHADPAVTRWLNETSPGDLRIAMGHYPDFALAAQDLPIDLYVAGHTHGGQIRAPFFGPIIELGSIPRWLASGYHQLGRTHVDVSAGIGCRRNSGLPPLRFNCPPEMTLIEFVPKRRAWSAGS